MNPYELTDWQRILFGEQPPLFLLEVLGRSLVMFCVIFLALRATGKRTVRQLSVIELVLIIGLGSAAGDPMFYDDVGLLPALAVFLIIIISYRLLAKLASKSVKLSDWVEGKAVLIIEEGVFAIAEFAKEDMGQDEFFMELRSAGVEHLGQLRRAYVESSGNISLYYYEDTDVKPGLPVLPELFAKRSAKIEQSGTYSCSFCGHVQHLPSSVLNQVCPRCKRNEWVKALHTRRVT
ncbi:DUF421 domain-containing protein [Spirosoma radiotolerans]|uniref:YetF C-terminal domain-containing protein n=1 Tax=Spirosoma radiotolerans TaxID=1379870 RepID=A0A0E3ZWJ2_9BACT|nr:YetF domain-containing protein [Spirosoma radiotolerans]AKD55775.1 hypothetical protein SD10_13555 [Spirosoma radiotolerans]